MMCFAHFGINRRLRAVLPSCTPAIRLAKAVHLSSKSIVDLGLGGY
jgi:hypothetical protein